MIAAILAPGLIVLVLPAVNLIARNEEFFRGDLTAGRDLYLLGLLLALTGFALWAISSNTVGRYLFISYLLVTPAWLAFTTLGQWRRAVGGLVVVMLVLATAWAIHRWGRSGSLGNLALISTLLVLASIVSTGFVVTSEATAAESVDAETLPSTLVAAPSESLPNIYHIVMDEYQTEMFEATLNDEVEQALSGFTYFPKARTTYGRTEMTMASIFAPSDYDYTTTPQEFVDASLRGPDSSLELLRRAGYRISAFVHLMSLYGSPSPFDETTLFRDYVDFDASGEYTRLANSLWVFAYLPGSLARLVVTDDHYAQLNGDNFLPDDAPAVSTLSFKTFINREGDLSPTGRYTLIHLVLPHFPYVMSAECGHSEGVDAQPVDQAMCATSLMVQFVEELRDLDRFDSSVIVIQGDHGARFALDGEELVQLEDDYYSEAWSDARSRPLVLVKPADVDSHEQLSTSDYPALVTDVMPTIFDSIHIPYEPHDGRVSLLDDSRPTRGIRYYHFYNKGDDGLPDGELARFIIEGEEIRYERTIELPTE